MYQLLVKRSHDKKQAKSAHHKGAVGRLIAIDTWGNGTCVRIAKGSDLQDPELVHGLQPKTVAVECLRLRQPRRLELGCIEAICDPMADHSHTRQQRPMA